MKNQLELPRTKVFMDTEFTGLHQKTTLVSIALVCGHKYFYAELTDYKKSQVDDWIKENVIDKLQLTNKITPAVSGWENWVSDDGVYENALEMCLARKDMSKFECIGESTMVKNRLEKWLSQFESIEIWSDCLAYDWVLFCELFGGAMHIPKNVYYIPFDICTIFKEQSIDPDISRVMFGVGNKDFERLQHNSHSDAIVIEACYNKLMLMKDNKANIWDDDYVPFYQRKAFKIAFLLLALCSSLFWWVMFLTFK